MCTVVLVRGVVPGAPVVLAANRDEQLARPSEGPQVLDAARGIVGGRDGEAGGTWLAVSRSGFFVALTNRPDDGTATGREQSRGHVVLGVARAGAQGGVEAARAWLETLEPGSTRPFQLLFGDRDEVWVAYVGDELTMEPVAPGIHVLPNGRLNSARFPKVARIRARLQSVPPTLPAMRAALWAVLADDTIPEDAPYWPHLPWPREVQAALHAVWVRLPGYGTCSSTLLALPEDAAPEYAFIDGPPAEPPTDHSHLLRPTPALPAWWPEGELDALTDLVGTRPPVVLHRAADGAVEAVTVRLAGPLDGAMLQAVWARVGEPHPLLSRWLALVPPGRCHLGVQVRWAPAGPASVEVGFGGLLARFGPVQAARRVLALATTAHVVLPPELSAPGAVDRVALVWSGTEPVAVRAEGRLFGPTTGPLVGCSHGPAGVSAERPESGGL